MPQFGNVVTVASYKCCNKPIRNNLSHTVASIPNKIRVLRNTLNFMRNLNAYTAPRAKTCDSSHSPNVIGFLWGCFWGLRYCPLQGQYASRFGYLPAANTPHKSIHCDPIPKSINTSQFPTQVFAFQIHSNKINENLASNHFTSSCVEFLESICCTFAHIPTASPHPYFRRSNE